MQCRLLEALNRNNVRGKKAITRQIRRIRGEKEEETCLSRQRGNGR